MAFEFALVFWSWLGSLLLYCTLRSDGKPVLQILEHVAPNWKHPLKHQCEVLVFTLLGCVIGYGLTDPVSELQAFSAGLGWTGLLTATPKLGALTQPRQARREG